MLSLKFINSANLYSNNIYCGSYYITYIPRLKTKIIYF